MGDQEHDALAELREQIGALSAESDLKIAKLASDGAPVQPASIIGVRLAVLLDQVLGAEDCEMRLRYELRVQQVIASQLAAVEEQVSSAAARAKLLQGVKGNGMPPGGQLPPKLILGR